MAAHTPCRAGPPPLLLLVTAHPYPCALLLLACRAGHGHCFARPCPCTLPGLSLVACLALPPAGAVPRRGGGCRMPGGMLCAHWYARPRRTLLVLPTQFGVWGGGRCGGRDRLAIMSAARARGSPATCCSSRRSGGRRFPKSFAPAGNLRRRLPESFAPAGNLRRRLPESLARGGGIGILFSWLSRARAVFRPWMVHFYPDLWYNGMASNRCVSMV